jgi:hypothetical protein
MVSKGERQRGARARISPVRNKLEQRQLQEMNDIHQAELSHQRYGAGRSALERGDRLSAIAFFQDSIAARPHFKTLELLGSALLEQGDIAGAVVHLAASAGLNPRQSKPRFLLAQAMLAHGPSWKADAAAQLRECLRLNPEYATAKQLLERLLSEDPSLVSDDVK